ncbi:MAG: protein translocase subunit SecD [Christensenellaceae bacterium]|nr:protein translocase subunit SecD [Christensenellaceae bacterium]
MSKTKATIILSIVAVFLIGAILLIFPLNQQESVQIGDSDYDFVWIANSIKLGLDLEGGMLAIYNANLSEFGSPTSDEAKNALNGTIANLSALLFSKGYTEAVVGLQGDSSIRVEIPAVNDAESLMNLLGEPATLEFKDPSGNVVITGGKHLSDAYATQYNGYYAVGLTFNDEGTTAFSTATSANVGSAISIWINGTKVLEPTVNTAITDGKAVITGNYTYDQANELALKIKAGTFELELTPTQISTISPTLGQDALKYGIIAGVVGLFTVIILIIIIYRGLGVVAAAALICYSTLLIYLLSIVPWVQLTLPGIAGIILSVGMAVDANIVIFERIKDERRTAKAIQSSVKAGFKKGLTSIIDANITTILGAIVMIIFGATAIQSFAITLLIGVLLSMFTAIIVSRLFINISLAFNDTSVVYYGLKIKEAVTNEKV